MIADKRGELCAEARGNRRRIVLQPSSQCFCGPQT
jgi:hypothetical protein